MQKGSKYVKDKGKSLKTLPHSRHSTKNHKKDLSNRAVLGVLVIVILVSVIVLGVYLEALERATPRTVPKATGAAFYIDTPAKYALAKSDHERARVSLTVDVPTQAEQIQNSNQVAGQPVQGG